MFSHPPGTYRDALRLWNTENFHGAIWAMPRKGFQAQKDVKAIQAEGQPEQKSVAEMTKKVEEPKKEEQKAAPKKMKAAKPKSDKLNKVKAAIKKMIDNRDMAKGKERAEV